MGRGRLGLSTIDKREIWSRWKAGETLDEIGRAYGKCHDTIRAVLLPRGGIPPLARRRSRAACLRPAGARGNQCKGELDMARKRPEPEHRGVSPSRFGAPREPVLWI